MRVGVVGTNFVSDTFMDGAKQVKEVSVTCVTSGHIENAKKFAEKYNIETVVSSLDEMLEKKLVDVVYLAVPNAMHYEMTKKCIEAHTAVLTEKPFVVTSKQAKDLFELAEKNHVYVHDGIMPLYSKGLEVIKENIKRVGKIHNVVFDFSKYSSRYDAYLEGKNPTTFRKELCNGAMMDLGVYCVSDVVSIFGKPNQIEASAELLETGADISSNAIFSYDDFSAVIMNSKASDSIYPCVISGEKGMLIIHGASLLNKIVFKDRKEKTEEILFEENQNPFVREIEDLVENIEQGYSESKKVPHALSIDIISCIEEIRHKTGIIYSCDEVKE